MKKLKSFFRLLKRAWEQSKAVCMGRCMKSRAGSMCSQIKQLWNADSMSTCGGDPWCARNNCNGASKRAPCSSVSFVPMRTNRVVRPYNCFISMFFTQVRHRMMIIFNVKTLTNLIFNITTQTFQLHNFMPNFRKRCYVLIC